MTKDDLHKILHIEDEPDIREIARLSLVRVGGFDLESCSSGEEALQKCPEFEPDLVLIDVMMPGMDGPTALQELRKLPGMAEIPVVFMTAKARPEEVESFITMGAAGVITKPFDPMQLPDQLRQIWQERKQ